jgi:hypothetical protein
MKKNIEYQRSFTTLNFSNNHKIADMNQRNRHFCVPDNGLPKIVVIGAGFAGLNLINRLENKSVQIILIDQNNYHQFQPLLYLVAISGLELDAIVSPVRKLFKSCSNMIYRMATCCVAVFQDGSLIRINMPA